MRLAAKKNLDNDVYILLGAAVAVVHCIKPDRGADFGLRF
jgi:hypothetical protein